LTQELNKAVLMAGNETESCLVVWTRLDSGQVCCRFWVPQYL
jgi:hypothetical protein